MLIKLPIFGAIDYSRIKLFCGLEMLYFIQTLWPPPNFKESYYHVNNHISVKETKVQRVTTKISCCGPNIHYLAGCHYYHAQEILAVEKLVNLMNSELFAKIFLANINSDTMKMYLTYILTLAYLPNFSSPIFYMYGSPKAFPVKIFPCMV